MSNFEAPQDKKKKKSKAATKSRTPRITRGNPNSPILGTSEGMLTGGKPMGSFGAINGGVDNGVNSGDISAFTKLISEHQKSQQSAEQHHDSRADNALQRGQQAAKLQGEIEKVAQQRAKTKQVEAVTSMAVKQAKDAGAAPLDINDTDTFGAVGDHLSSAPALGSLEDEGPRPFTPESLTETMSAILQGTDPQSQAGKDTISKFNAFKNLLESSDKGVSTNPIVAAANKTLMEESLKNINFLSTQNAEWRQDAFDLRDEIERMQADTSFFGPSKGRISRSQRKLALLEAEIRRGQDSMAKSQSHMSAVEANRLGRRNDKVQKSLTLLQNQLLLNRELREQEAHSLSQSRGKQGLLLNTKADKRAEQEDQRQSISLLMRGDMNAQQKTKWLRDAKRDDARLTETARHNAARELQAKKDKAIAANNGKQLSRADLEALNLYDAVNKKRHLGIINDANKAEKDSPYKKFVLGTDDTPDHLKNFYDEQYRRALHGAPDTGDDSGPPTLEKFNDTKQLEDWLLLGPGGKITEKLDGNSQAISGGIGGRGHTFKRTVWEQNAPLRAQSAARLAEAKKMIALIEAKSRERFFDPANPVEVNSKNATAVSVRHDVLKQEAKTHKVMLQRLSRANDRIQNRGKKK